MNQIYETLVGLVPALSAIMLTIGLLTFMVRSTKTVISHLPHMGGKRIAEDERPATVSQLDWATQKLAESTRVQWEEEAYRLGLMARPGYAATAPKLAASLIRIGWSVDTESMPILPGDKPTPTPGTWGDNPSVDQLADFFHEFEPKALVVLGSAEAGKSAAAVLLTINLLSKRTRDDDPVPVKFNLDHWDPGLNLANWLTQRMLDEHPGFKSAATYGENVVARLLQQGRVLPILDGLDELAGSDEPSAQRERDRVIEEIDRSTLRLPGLILTCQHEIYDELDHRLREAVVVRLQGVPTAEAHRYIENASHEHKHPERWKPVLDHLSTHKDGPLATALVSPLMVYLVPRVYRDPASNPADLMELGDAESIKEHLLRAYVPSVFPVIADRARGHPWRASDAVRWLGFLAAKLEQSGGASDAPATRFGWWELSRFGRPATGIMAGLVAALVGGAAVGLAFRALFSEPAGFAAGGITGLVLGFLSWRNDPPKPSETQRRVGSRWSSIIRSGLAVGIIVFVGGALARDISLAIVAGLGFGVPIALLYGFTEPDPTLRPLDPRLLLRLDIRVGITFAVTYGVPAGITGWFLTRDLTLSVAVGAGSALAGALLYGPIWILAAITPLGGIGKLRAVGVVAFVHLGLAILRFAPGRTLPWRVVAFLDEAHDLGVLRVVSGSYQFRHAALQRVLAADYTTGPEPQRAPKAVTEASSGAWQHDAEA